ncbi:MAG: hypothetical protein ACYDCO_22275 [Armatimonadota bacterium]
MLLQAPAPPFDQTWLAVWGNDEELLVGAALLDSRPAVSGEFLDDLEILLDPRGDELPFNAMATGDRWEGTAAPTIPGRYRLSALATGRVVEPEYIAIDLSSVERAQSFYLSTTVDVPMSLCMNHFTPERNGPPGRTTTSWCSTAGAGLQRASAWCSRR